MSTAPVPDSYFAAADAILRATFDSGDESLEAWRSDPVFVFIRTGMVFTQSELAWADGFLQRLGMLPMRQATGEDASPDVRTNEGEGNPPLGM